MLKSNSLKTGSLVFGIALLGIVMSLGGCQSPAEDSTASLLPLGPGEGRIRLMSAARAIVNPDTDTLRREEGVLLTSATIDVIAVDVHGTDGRWYRFDLEPYSLDLLQLGSSFTSVMGRATAMEGSYDQVRLITADIGHAVFEDGRETDLRVPSGPQTGIKIHFGTPLQVSAGRISIVGIAFDTNKSFVFPGSGIVHFKPVVKVVGQTIVELPEDTGGDTGGGDTGGDTGGGDTGGGDTGGGGTIGDPGDGSVGDPGDGSVGEVLPTEPGDTDPGNFPPVFGV